MLRGSTIEGSETLLRLGKGSVLGKVWGCVRLHMDVSFLRGPPKLVCFLVVFKGTPPKKDNKQKQNSPVYLEHVHLELLWPSAGFSTSILPCRFLGSPKTRWGGARLPLGGNRSHRFPPALRRRPAPARRAGSGCWRCSCCALPRPGEAVG